MTTPADPAERALELARLIRHHDELYYGTGQIEITDAEYDALIRELRQIEAEHPELVTADSPTQRVATASPGATFAPVVHP